MDKRNPETQEILTELTDLESFFYLTFRFSQNDVSLQRDFFSWARSVDIFEPQFASNQLKGFRLPKLHTYVGRERALSEFEDQWKNMQKIFSEKTLTPINYVKSVVQKMIGRDLLYQTTERPNRNSATLPDSQFDKHASYVRKFILGGHETGSSAFNKLFSDAKKEITSETFKIQLAALAGSWEHSHPGEKFTP